VRSTAAGRGPSAGLALLAAGLIAYAAFNAGGFFAGTPAVAATLLAFGLVLRVTVADEPFAGIGARLLLPIGALTLYTVWVLVSAAWSHAPGRATVEFDRALLYLLVLVLFGSWPGSAERSRWLLRGLAVVSVGVCTVALLSRLLPDVVHTSPILHNERLSFPLTYWNALGLMAAIAIVLCLYLASAKEEPAFMRVFGAGALPVVFTVLYFTFSRGAIGAAVVGVLVFAILGRSRSLLLGLLGGAPAAAIAVSAAYGAGLLAKPHPTTPAATAQGHSVALVVVACVVGAIVLRSALCLLERRLTEATLPFRAGRSSRIAGLVAVLVAVVIVAVALKLPGRADHAISQFAHSSPAVTSKRDLRNRLGSASNNGRLALWRVSLNSFKAHPLIGKGAGTFQNQWLQNRPTTDRVNDGHSLYAETLGELGVVGGVLILVLVGSILVGFAVRERAPNRTLGAAFLAAALAWAVHAGIDWDWEMPAVTLWIFAAGGTLLAAAPPSIAATTAAPAKSRGPSQRTRVLSGIACLVLAITPVRVFLSQGELNRSVAAFTRGDCNTAITHSLSSISAFSSRPDPYQVLAYCDMQAGQPGLGLTQMKRAVALDPNDSTLRYGLAVLRAASGQDPRPDARAALRLDPRGVVEQDAVRRFDTGSARSWERGARSAPLSLGP
jgi:O-antigen ligase